MTTTTTTEALILTLEGFALGEPWTAEHAAAVAAVAADRARALAVMFPSDLQPTPSDAISAYAWYVGRLGPLGYGDSMADLHRRSLRSHPALAGLLRSPEALADVGEAAASRAPSGEHATSADAARRRYQLAVARQLAESPGHELAAGARAFLATEVLVARVAAAQAKHEEHERAEVARLEAERQAEQVAADTAADAAALEIELAATLRSYGLPETLRVGVFVDEHRKRLAALVTVRRRLRSTRATSVRVGTSVYAPMDLSFAIGDAGVAELDAYRAALDAAEGRAS
jgi:hypothetical protein